MHRNDAETRRREAVPAVTAAVEAFGAEVARLPYAGRHAGSGDPGSIGRAVEGLLRAASAAEQALADQPERLRETQAWFRDRTAPFFSRSPLLQRALHKPRGYAGDHAMLDMLYLGKRSDRGLERALDEYVLELAAVRAVVTRKAYARRWLAERLAEAPHAMVVDLACGPCRLERELLEDGAGARARLVALDSDGEALAYARGVLDGHAHRVALHQENAVRLARSPELPPLVAGARYVVCLGLFDYLPRNVAVALLRQLRRATQPGGELLVGNFADDNPSRTFMDWALDWPLIHRTEESFSALFLEAGFGPEDLHVEREAPGGAVLLVNALVR